MVLQTIAAYIVAAFIILILAGVGLSLLSTGNAILAFIGLGLVLAAYFLFNKVKK